jgi:hypothetical protein
MRADYPGSRLLSQDCGSSEKGPYEHVHEDWKVGMRVFKDFITSPLPFTVLFTVRPEQ